MPAINNQNFNGQDSNAEFHAQANAAKAGPPQKYRLAIGHNGEEVEMDTHPSTKHTFKSASAAIGDSTIDPSKHLKLAMAAEKTDPEKAAWHLIEYLAVIGEQGELPKNYPEKDAAGNEVTSYTRTGADGKEITVAKEIRDKGDKVWYEVTPGEGPRTIKVPRLGDNGKPDPSGAYDTLEYDKEGKFVGAIIANGSPGNSQVNPEKLKQAKMEALQVEQEARGKSATISDKSLLAEPIQKSINAAVDVVGSVVNGAGGVNAPAAQAAPVVQVAVDVQAPAPAAVAGYRAVNAAGVVAALSGNGAAAGKVAAVDAPPVASLAPAAADSVVAAGAPNPANAAGKGAAAPASAGGGGGQPTLVSEFQQSANLAAVAKSHEHQIVDPTVQSVAAPAHAVVAPAPVVGAVAALQPIANAATPVPAPARAHKMIAIQAGTGVVVRNNNSDPVQMQGGMIKKADPFPIVNESGLAASGLSPTSTPGKAPGQGQGQGQG